MDLTPDAIMLGLLWFVVFLFSTTLHEAAHAFVAFRLGDPTAYEGGQVTLNPMPHIQREPFGMVLVPLVSFALSGWMMGWASAPYNPAWADRYPRRAAWMALAGPVSNLLLVVVSGLLIRIGMAVGVLGAPESLSFSALVAATTPGLFDSIATLLSIMLTLNLLLFVFNLIPLPPLDGSGVLPLFMPASAARAYRDFMHQPMFSLLGILVAWRLIGALFSPVLGAVIALLYA